MPPVVAAAGAGGPRASRIPAIDWLKALAIVAVALNHAGPFLLGPQAGAFDRFVRGGLCAFHVPTFLVVSGFLYQRAVPQSLAQVGRRLARFLVPYLVGSAAAFAFGFAPWQSAADVMRHLLFASAIGTYYYFFLLAVFVAGIWPLSRMRPAAVAALLAGVCGFALAAQLAPALQPRESFFWAMRNPLHFAGYFLCGWLAAAWRAPLARFAGERRPLVWGAAALATAAWVALLAGALPVRLRPLLLAGYVLAVVACVATLARARPAPPLVRWLSDATLTLYLYHHMIELSLLPHFLPLPAPLRTPLLASAGLAGSAALLFAARALLGRRAARWLFGT
jgi:fucose 4-O-acetylase-like acetyltransferase